jgi:hypothetical protein
MNDSWSWAISFVSALMATLTGVLVGARLSQRGQFAQWSRESSLDVCTGLLRAYASVYDGLSHACRHGIEPVIDWTQWNQALAAVSLTSTRSIVEAAVVLDDVVWSVDTDIVKGNRGLETWLMRRESLEDARLHFVNIARKEFTLDRSLLDHAAGATRGSGHWQGRYMPAPDESE